MAIVEVSVVPSVMNRSLEYAQELIRFDSVSANSNVDVTEQVEQWLWKLGFEIERIDFVDPEGVPKSNIVAKRGTGLGGMAYFCHTDVVPAEDWRFDDHGPFDPVVREDRLYGRGSTDMKGSLACMLAAVESVSQARQHSPVYICCTADEEVGMLGAQHVVKHSSLYREIVDGGTRCIVGEPSRLAVVHGHKAGCGIIVTSRGRAAHSSTNKGVNANWKMIPFLKQMKDLYEELESDPKWKNEEFSPPTMSLNLGINDHTPAVNITPPQSIATIYFRSMPGISSDPVIERIQQAAAEQGLEFEITFRSSPFFVPADSHFVQECLEFAKSRTPHTVSYGTDAARFQELKQCVIMGPGDIAQAHTNDEWILLQDLEDGTATYTRMLKKWCETT